MEQLRGYVLIASVVLLIVGLVYMLKKVKTTASGVQDEKDLQRKKAGKIMTIVASAALASVGALYAYERYGKKSAPKSARLRYYYF